MRVESLHCDTELGMLFLKISQMPSYLGLLFCLAANLVNETHNVFCGV